MHSNPILKIALPVPLRKVFDYRPLPGALPAPGVRFLVPFGRRELVGLLIEVGTASRDYPAHKLQQPRAQLDDAPILPAALFTLCQRAATYYHQPLGQMLATALPVWLRQGKAVDAASERHWCLTERGRFVEAEQFRQAHRQQEAWVILKQHEHGLSLPALRLLDVKPATLKGLQKKGWAEEVDRVVVPSSHPLLAETALPANSEQHNAIATISRSSDYHAFLLDGVTGSGKTEVYLQAAANALQQGKQVLVLVPEIGLTPQTLNRFRARFNRRVEGLHSGMTHRQRLGVWEAARRGEIDIIMGTRSALFAPLTNLGLIIVDEAHDRSFKQQEGCRYHARSLAMMRAQIEKIPVVLGSATPSLESLRLAQNGKLTRLRLSQRAAAQPPQLLLDDCQQQPANQLLSQRSQAAIASCLEAGNQVLIFLNRRGYAPLITCHNCGRQQECPNCDRFMTWHKRIQRSICHHCDRQTRVPAHCPDCGSSQLGDVGAGTEKLEEYLQAHFPDFPVIRIDRDATRRKGSMEAKLAQIQQGDAAILTGTQMLAKGHHFPQLALTVILDADNGFLSADFRGAEQAGQLILQVAGRTGRGDQPGQVILQTRHPDLPGLQTLIRNDWSLFANQLLKNRQQVGLPPFTHAALFAAEAQKAPQAQAFLSLVLRQLPQHPALVPLGPAPAPLEKRAGRYRFQLLLLSSDRPRLHQTLQQLLPQIEKQPESRRCRWFLDVDPIDML